MHSLVGQVTYQSVSLTHLALVRLSERRMADSITPNTAPTTKMPFTLQPIASLAVAGSLRDGPHPATYRPHRKSSPTSVSPIQATVRGPPPALIAQYRCDQPAVCDHPSVLIEPSRPALRPIVGVVLRPVVGPTFQHHPAAVPCQGLRQHQVSSPLCSLALLIAASVDQLDDSLQMPARAPP